MTEQSLSSAAALEEVRKRRQLIDRCDAYLFGQIKPFLGKRVLEVGSGHGNLIAHLLDRDLVVATDIDEASVRIIGGRYGTCKNVLATVCDISSAQAVSLRRYNCDTVVSLNTLEHIQADEMAIANMANIAIPGGRVIIIVPALPFLYGTMDASIGHFRRYTSLQLLATLAHAGLEPERQDYFNLFGVLGWFVNGKILHRQVPPSGQLRLFNILFPVSSRVESWLPWKIGLSLISISRVPLPRDSRLP